MSALTIHAAAIGNPTTLCGRTVVGLEVTPLLKNVNCGDCLEMADDKDVIAFSVRVPAEIIEKVKHVAAKQGVEWKVLLETYLRAKLAEYLE